QIPRVAAGLHGEGHRRQGRQPRRLQRQSRVARQRRQQVRLHAAIRGPGKGLQKVQRPRLRHHRLSPNNFGGQEPGSDEQIKTFCTSKYDVTFPMMSKISVKGDDKHAVYKFLTEKETDGEFAGEIGWNFTKFLIDRNGAVMARYASKTKPEDPTV